MKIGKTMSVVPAPSIRKAG
jgi:hypothetical protein